MRVNGEKGAFDKLVSAISKADIVGYEPIEIIAKDFTAPIASKPEMELQLTNILNRPVKGVLSVSIGNLDLSYPQNVSFKPNETKTIRLKFISMQEKMDSPCIGKICMSITLQRKR